jgi:SAM-dependent methyltransferase
MFNNFRKNYEFHKKNFFKGKDIYCPFCSGTYKAQKFKFTKEADTICPVCSSTIEERTVLLFLQAKTEMLPGEPKILVICEEGKIPEYFRNFPNAEVKIYSETGDFTIRDNTLKDKYESASFDLIVCNYILEKLPEYTPALKEFVRILKPEGIILLQANIDYEKEKTAEFPLTSYKDRIAMYGIPGNHRRFGKDYQSLIKANKLNISKLKFTEGFEELPPLSFNKDEIFYIAYKSDQPVLFDNMDDLEAEMSEQRSNVRTSYFSAVVYTVMFIMPEILKKYLFSVLGNISEHEDNKGTFVYMFYVLMTGLSAYWLGTILFIKMVKISLILFFFALPVLLIIGFGGAAILTGYVFINDKADYFKKAIVAFLFFASMFLSLRLPFLM